MLLYNSDFKAFFFSQNYELSKSLLPVHVYCWNLFWIYTAKSGLRHTEETVISNRQRVLYSLGRAACLWEPLPPSYKVLLWIAVTRVLWGWSLRQVGLNCVLFVRYPHPGSNWHSRSQNDLDNQRELGYEAHHALNHFITWTAKHHAHCEQSSRDGYIEHFQWIASMITTGGINTPKTIIFCTSLTDVAKLVSNLFAMLGDALYEPGKPHHPSNRLVGIYPRRGQTTPQMGHLD